MPPRRIADSGRSRWPELLGHFKRRSAKSVRGQRRCQRVIYELAGSRPGSLLTDRAIDRFAEEVCVAGVAGSLLDEVQQHPPEREVPPVTQRPDR